MDEEKKKKIHGKVETLLLCSSIEQQFGFIPIPKRRFLLLLLLLLLPLTRSLVVNTMA